MTCRDCKKNVVREFRGDFNTQGRRIYVTAEGRAWRGLRCPTCSAFPNFKTPETKIRFCTKCGQKNEPSRYYECLTCVPQLREDFFTHSLTWGSI